MKNTNYLHLSVVVVLVTALFSFLVLSHVVHADTIVGDPFDSTSTSNLQVTNYLGGPYYWGVRVPTYTYTIPFNQEVYDQDSSLYTFDSSYTYNYVLSFPVQAQYQYLTGSWRIPFHVNMTHNFYAQPGSLGAITSVSPSLFTDSTFRFDISSLEVLEGVSVSVIPNESASLSDYQIRIDFSDFQPTQQLLTIPLSFHVQGTIVDNGQDSLGRQLTAYNLQTTFSPAASYTSSLISFVQPSFHLSNEYYTILQALNDSNMSGSSSSGLVQSILDLLEAWTEDSNGVMVDFPYFSDQILTYLGSLDSNTDDLESYMSTALGYLITIMDNTDQLETYLSNIYNTLHLNNYGTVTTSITPYKDVVSLLVSLCAGFTGADATSQSISSIRTTTYNRWVSLIQEAVVAGLEQSGQASSTDQTQYENDMDTVSSVGSSNHDYEVSLWTDVQSRYQNIVGDAAPPSKTLDSAVWFTSAIEYVWAHLGIFAFVISVSIVGGYLVVVLGRINQFGRIK